MGGDSKIRKPTFWLWLFGLLLLRNPHRVQAGPRNSGFRRLSPAGLFIQRVLPVAFFPPAQEPFPTSVVISDTWRYCPPESQFHYTARRRYMRVLHKCSSASFNRARRSFPPAHVGLLQPLPHVEGRVQQTLGKRQPVRFGKMVGGGQQLGKKVEGLRKNRHLLSLHVGCSWLVAPGLIHLDAWPEQGNQTILVWSGLRRSALMSEPRLLVPI